ncbi:phosphatidylglycerophosphate synthase [Longilinea arvoryzae]|uniref:Phosphatidylglycerophosphate synthase n=1 Tax=Longilinea arvoryzae TaxID=360412 RepID=A0A0S7BJ44_9CHLR|nr:CDP-alcohol phosphatidyltransferase family protein [Longilinea arvoryzae]GAP15140.1 phosphatidylglycerophosphate synthase [Longilinea arvoryzae]
MEESAKQQPATFTDFLRVRFKGVLDPIGRFLNSLGLMPNVMTIMGLVGNIGAAYLLAMGHITWGGIVVLLMGPIDALDGTMARLRGQPSRFGAFVDSVTDRYSELVILLGLLVYYLRAGDALFAGLIYLAAAGSVLVSYVKARAEALNFEAKVGLLTRVERYLIMAPCLIFNIPKVAIVILAVFANITAFQRILAVRKQAYEQNAVHK